VHNDIEVVTVCSKIPIKTIVENCKDPVEGTMPVFAGKHLCFDIAEWKFNIVRIGF